MGHEARLNPRSLDGGTPEAVVLDALFSRFAEAFATRQEYETYLSRANVTDRERGYLEPLLPARLREGGRV
jgi:hypothetical protein